jgi:maltose-binding protein MalE
MEFARQLWDGNEPLKERTLNRTLERIGQHFPVVFLRYQQFLKKHGLIDQQQNHRFLLSLFLKEGRKSELANYGYSWDKRPGKMLINFGISTGINVIPTAITIQKGVMFRIRNICGGVCSD